MSCIMSGTILSRLSRLCSRTDEESMWLVKTRNDHQAFARLVRRWEGPIRRLCARMTGDPDRGEDLKQEIFIRLFEKRGDYQPTARFSTYLWRMALNRCYDELRRQKRQRAFMSEAQDTDGAASIEEMPSEAPGPDARAATADEGGLVRAALLQLPEIYRAVVVLRHYEGLKLSQIAEVLEIPEGTVNSRMAEALSRLGRLLKPKLRDAPGGVQAAPGTQSPPADRVCRHKESVIL
jgi:RNA polymerase sigma-70 factor, ECF subfamily